MSVPVAAARGNDSALLDVAGVSKSYGGLHVLTDVGLTVGPQERVALIGSNGAGKTTLFNIITRLEQADAGTIRFAGRDLSKTAPYALSSLGVARTFQHTALFPSLDVKANVEAPLLVADRVGIAKAGFRGPAFTSKARGRREKVSRTLADFKLSHEADSRVAELPYATQRRVEIARAVVMEPKLLILDEPAGGLNKSDVDDLEQLLRRVQAEYSLSLLLIEHNMRFVMGLSDHVYVLEHGELIADGDVASVTSNPLVIETYLGKAHENA